MENVVYRYYKHVEVDCQFKIKQSELDNNHTPKEIEMVTITKSGSYRIVIDAIMTDELIKKHYFELRSKDLYEQAKLRIENLIEK